MLTAVFGGLAWLGLGIVAVRSQNAPQPAGARSGFAGIDRGASRGTWLPAAGRSTGVRRSGDGGDDWLATADLAFAVGLENLDDCRAAGDLAHEIAHAKSQDYLALLGGQLGVTLHFYHPLVHWLMNRLRLEQELAADAAAASVSGGQRQYLRTIAELALRRQDRPLSWPARSFLPSRNTLIRRIAMLRDSKLRFERLSLSGRTLTAGVVVLCGLLVAGLRGPNGPRAALADERSKADDATMAAHSEPVSEQIDLTFIPATAKSLIVFQPAAAVKNPAMSSWADMFEKTGNFVPKGTHLADFRQITCVLGYNIPQGQREIVIYQFVKPTDVSALNKEMKEIHPADAEYTGRKLYAKVLPMIDGRAQAVVGETILQYDDRTIITAGSEKAMTMYIRDKRRSASVVDAGKAVGTL